MFLFSSEVRGLSALHSFVGGGHFSDVSQGEMSVIHFSLLGHRNTLHSNRV